MTEPNHAWTFRSRFRARAYGWHSSRLACARVREAVAEIRGVARGDPVLAAEGAVLFVERLVPAIEHVNSSSGALGTAVARALDVLIPLIIDAPVPDGVRSAWLDRLWEAQQSDGFGYLAATGDRWGELCGSPELAASWADWLAPVLRDVWSRRRPGDFLQGETACLSAMLRAGRHAELLELLRLAPYPSLLYRRYGIQALLAEGRKAEALRYARESESWPPDEPDPEVARMCEDILLSSGMAEEAYRRYAIAANTRGTRLATFRAIQRRYPDKPVEEILADLVAASPGQEGKWFATARRLGMKDFALRLAERSPCDPRTLNRAARDHLEDDPAFALGAALTALRWMARGHGYEVSTADAAAASRFALRAAAALGREAEIEGQIRALAEADRSPAGFVRSALELRIPVGLD